MRNAYLEIRDERFATKKEHYVVCQDRGHESYSLARTNVSPERYVNNTKVKNPENWWESCKWCGCSYITKSVVKISETNIPEQDKNA